jgi:hypothetical protein
MMKSWARAVAVLLVVVAAFVAVLVAVAWAVFPLDRIAVAIDGATYSLADLHGWEVVLAFVAAVAAVVLALAVALGAVVLAMAVGAIGLAVGLLAAVASVAVVVTPFVFVGWLLWRLVRKQRQIATVPGP